MTRVSLLVAACLALAALAATPAALARPASTTITVIEGKPSEFKYKLSSSTAKVGSITFKVTDSGQLPHDFKFCTKKVTSDAANTCTGKGTVAISPGGSATLKVTVSAAGSYEYLCTLPGHAAAGMKGLLKVS